MSNTFERVMNTSRPHLPGAVDDAMRQELFEVCLEFLTLSTAWRDTFEVTMPARERRAFIQPNAGRILNLLYVRDRDHFVYGASIPEEGILEVRSDATSVRNLEVTVSLVVTDPLTRDAYPIIPSYIVRNHHQAILWGLLARMMAQPSKPYTNPQMAAYYAQRFRGEASRARNTTETGRVPGGQNWRFPPFA